MATPSEVRAKRAKVLAKRQSRSVRSAARSSSVLLRMSPEERELLALAAAERGTSVNELVLAAVQPLLTTP